jgi:release factor glutamine methyltransferase
LRVLLASAAEQLRAAGVDSPEADARLLIAHVLDVEPSRLFLLDAVNDEQAASFVRLVDRRAVRVPLQHLTGQAFFRHERLEVGPGVFVPRPETEVMTGWAVAHLQLLCAAGQTPQVAELCAGSGAISAAIAHEVPKAQIAAVELSEEAADWARGNLAGTGVDLYVEDMADALHHLDGAVDLVIANPPYIPLDAYLSVPPEVRDHDPSVALFSGADGLDALRVVAQVAARLLRPGGVVAAEHADVQSEPAPAVFLEPGVFDSVRDHRDLAGRPRFVTAVRRS